MIGKFKDGLVPAQDPDDKILQVTRLSYGNLSNLLNSGIVGMGGIGTVMAQRALAFNMKIAYFNRNQIAPTELKKRFPLHYAQIKVRLLSVYLIDSI